jgi:hypothetical protein
MTEKNPNNHPAPHQRDGFAEPSRSGKAAIVNDRPQGGPVPRSDYTGKVPPQAHDK